MSTTQWSFGDRVVHAAKPEWGQGIITAAASSEHEGKPCQRVTVRFDRAGVKILSTAIAELRAAVTTPSPESAVAVAAAPVSEDVPTTSEGGWLGSVKPPSPTESLLRLPPSTTDPFTTLTARLRATLALFRFSDSGAPLLDWAAAQTGMKDPLSVFSRHELEQAYRRFTFVRDEHLRKLMNDARRQDPSILPSVSRDAPASGQQAMRRIDASR